MSTFGSLSKSLSAGFEELALDVVAAAAAAAPSRGLTTAVACDGGFLTALPDEELVDADEIGRDALGLVMWLCRLDATAAAKFALFDGIVGGRCFVVLATFAVRLFSN